MFNLKKIEKRGLIQALSNTFSQSKPTIPIIDVEGLTKGGLKEKINIGHKIDEANRKIGFFLVKNTGINMDFIERTLEASEQFFTSSMENKIKCRIDNVSEYKPWGYFPRNRELLQRGKDYDKKERSSYLNDVNESFNIQNDKNFTH
jgi:isopenicillin N synthase-like dioxygenase